MQKSPIIRGDASVSVVTRTLGHTPFLGRCLSAIRGASTNVPVEWIVVDDGSDDPSALRTFIEHASEAGIPAQIVRSNARHRAKAASAGLAAASGSYVHFLDDDDVVLPGFYEATMGMLEKDQRLGAAAVKCERVLEVAEEDGSFRELSRTPHYPEVTVVTLASLAVTQTIPFISVVFRRDLLEKIGGFDPQFEVSEDYDLLLRFLCVADIGISRDCLIRIHQRQTSSGLTANSRMTSDFSVETAHFRNAMLRRDLSEGRIGLGWLLAFAELSTGSVKTERILAQLYKFRFLNSAFAILRRR